MKRLLALVAVLATAATVSTALAQAPPPGGGRGGFAPVVIGPPAPVPPEVTIPRPTQAELEQVNAAMKRFVDNDKSAVQPLLKKFAPLMRISKLPSAPNASDAVPLIT